MSTKKLKDNEMSTDKLTVGDIVTYKKICELTNQPHFDGGNQKKYQLENFKRYFDYEKDGNKFLITDIYDVPLPKDYKIPSNAIYVKYIECILLQYLSKQNDNVAYLSSASLWSQLGMINDNFLKYQEKDHDYLLSLDNNMTEFEISDFYKRCKQKFYKILRSSLDSLQHRFLIKYEHKYVIGIEFINGEVVYKIASNNEVEEILKIKRSILNEFGCDNEQQIYLKGYAMPYYKKLNKEFIEQCNWKNVFQTYEIVYNKDNVIKTIPEDEVKLQKLMLNEEIIKSINDQAFKNYNKSIISNVLDNLYSQNHVQIQELLSDELLRISLKPLDK